ncbi:NTP transferase domain-containing protein [Lysobacter sp. CA196]|uniref:NTP transferase domain-containing protein n=1 Tax=Lysobacter sp. CA196 TaxID=3455606 RepID=UPI003F8D8A31
MAHVAVVLAAGASRRLGQPKQGLRRDGETLLHRAARLATTTAAQRVLVVLGAQSGAMAASIADLAVECIDNELWEEGLASSLRAAARALADFDGPMLVLGCDQPALEAGQLQALLDGAAAAASGCAATAHGDALGIPAVIAAAIWREAGQLSGDRGFGAALKRLPIETVWRLRAPELEHDLDTPADLIAAMTRGWIDEA